MAMKKGVKQLIAEATARIKTVSVEEALAEELSVAADAVDVVAVMAVDLAQAEFIKSLITS